MAIVMTRRIDPRSPGASRLSRRQTPHIAVPTTAGTGSEVSLYIVVKDDARAREDALMDDRIIPDAAVLDPSVTLAMPAQLTAGDRDGRAHPRRRGVYVDQTRTRSPTGWRCRRCG